MMKLDVLLQPWNIASIPEVQVTGIQNDSRAVRKGDLFIAYPGTVADGRLYIEQAIRSGATAVVYDPLNLPKSVRIPTHIPCIPLPHVGHNLAILANLFYECPSRYLTLTGVTGTNGKTTIAYQLAQAYELLGQSAAYIGTIGQGTPKKLTPLSNTTPDAINLQHLLSNYKKQGIQQVCMEVSSHALDQNRAEGIEFTQAIYTNLSHEHLDYHHTLEAYAEAKARLFACPSLETAVFNNDDEYAPFMGSKVPRPCKILSYGLSMGSDVRGFNIELSMSGSYFAVESPWGFFEVKSKVLGTFNIYNTLAILSSLLARGFDSKSIIEAVQKIDPAPGRMQVVAQEPYVIVDYAHTPDALQNVLSALIKLNKGRLIVVFGCGGDRDKSKRPMMGQIAGEYGDILIITNDNPRTEDPEQIIKEIEQGIPKQITTYKIMDREQAIIKAISLANSQDVILIAGKGHEDYQQIGHKKHIFSDQQVVEKLLNTTYI
jgi:UDP-N-acetylmuramoyl-L-alanyl-D-glutamate--2,6-diaminopimelate ligase